MNHGPPRATCAGNGASGQLLTPGGVKTGAVGASTGQGHKRCIGEIGYFSANVSHARTKAQADSVERPAWLRPAPEPIRATAHWGSGRAAGVLQRRSAGDLATGLSGRATGTVEAGRQLGPRNLDGCVVAAAEGAVGRWSASACRRLSRHWRPSLGRRRSCSNASARWASVRPAGRGSALKQAHGASLTAMRDQRAVWKTISRRRRK